MDNAEREMMNEGREVRRLCSQLGARLATRLPSELLGDDRSV